MPVRNSLRILFQPLLTAEHQYSPSIGTLDGMLLKYDCVFRISEKEERMKSKISLSDIWLAIRKPEIVFLCLALPFCIAFSLAIPAGAGYDENFHLARIYELAHGNLFTDPIEASSGIDENAEWGGLLDKGYFETAQKNWESFHLNHPDSFDFPIWTDEAISSDASLNTEFETYAYGSAAIYSPIVYFPYIIGYWIGSIFLTNAYALIIFMRISGIIFYCFVMFFCIRFIKFGKWPLCCIALFPNTLCTFSTITADPLSFLGVVGTIVVFLELCTAKTLNNRRLLLLVTLAALTVFMSKVAYIPILGVFLTLPIWNKNFRSIRAFYPILIILLVIGLLFLLWYLKANTATLTVGTTFGKGISPSEQMSFIIHQPFAYLKVLFTSLMKQTIFAFGSPGVAFGYVKQGEWLEVLIFCIASFVHDPREEVPETIQLRKGLFTLMCIVLFFIIAALIYTALYIQYTTFMASSVDGVQARYFIPLLPLLLLPVSLLSSSNQITDTPSVQKGLNGRRYLSILLCADLVITILLVYMKVF